MKTDTVIPMLATAVVSLLLISFFVWVFLGRRVDITAELSKLNPGKDTTDLMEFEDCTELNKTDTEWVLWGCRDDVAIHLVFLPSGRYVMKICGGWENGKEAARKASGILGVLGIEVDCDLTSTALLRTENDVNIYSVCEKELYFKDGCIV